MPDRNSRSRVRSSQSLPRLGSNASVPGSKKEVVYLVCTVHAFARKSLKPREQISQEAVENFVRKRSRVRPNHFELYFLEDRIRFKPQNVGLRTHLHPTVPYKQIKGAFSVMEKPNWLILGNLYQPKNHRKLESFYFPNVPDADRAKELLLMVKNHPDSLLQGVEPVGLVSTGSTRSLSRPSSIEYHTVDQQSRSSLDCSPRSTLYDRAEQVPMAETNGKASQGLHSRGTSPIVHPLLLADSPIEDEPVYKYKPVNREAPRHGRSESMHELVVDYALAVNRARQPNHNNHELSRLSSQTLYALGNQAPGSLIFISSTPSKGVYVSDDGPVYMFCQVEQ